MFLGLTILEVVISTVFVYLLFSLICSAVNDSIARFLALRSNTLEAGIRGLLLDPSGEKLAKQFYEHPLINSLARDSYFDKIISNIWTRKSKPAQISPRLFVLTLLDVLAEFKPDEPFEDSQDSAGSNPDGTSEEASEDSQPSIISNPVEAAENSLDLANIPDEFKELLRTLLRETDDSIQSVTNRLEDWFNEGMAEVSLWYKRKVHVILVIIAFLLTFSLNVDTLVLINSFWTNPTLRASVVAMADNVQTEDDDVSQIDVGDIESQLDQLDLPIGWKMCQSDEQDNDTAQNSEIDTTCVNEFKPSNTAFFIRKVLGISVSAIAIAMGAPFWFDLLKQLIGLRKTITSRISSESDTEQTTSTPV